MTNGTVAENYRTVTDGRVIPGGYIITLDGKNEVFTPDGDVFEVARSAKKEGRQVSVDLDNRPGEAQPLILELKLAPKQEIVKAEPTTAKAAPAATRALVTAPALPTGLIHKPEELAAQLEQMTKHYHVLSPAIAVSNLAEGYGANLALVKIDSTITMDEFGNGQGPDCYFSKSMHKDVNKRSLNKQGVMKIADAAGVQWMPGHCRRTDDRRTKNYWSWTYAGTVRTHDGQVKVLQGSKTVDLRDGSAAALDMKSEIALRKARAMGDELAETKAMLRASRNVGIRASYTVEELKKPFLIVRFSFTPDMSDPEIKKLVTERSISGVGALYSAPSAELPAAALISAPPVGVDEDHDDDDAETSATAAAIPGAATDFVLPEDARFLAEIKVAGKSKPGAPKPWIRYEVIAKTGEIWSTFKESHKAIVDDAIAKGWPVRVEAKESEKYPDTVDLVSIVLIDPRQGDLLNGGQTPAQKAGF
jgi:hypothetical protein